MTRARMFRAVATVCKAYSLVKAEARVFAELDSVQLRGVPAWQVTIAVRRRRP